MSAMIRLRRSPKNSDSITLIILLSSLLVDGRLCCDEADAKTAYAVLGSPAIITCDGYDAMRTAENSTRNISDIFSVRWFKNLRSAEYIVFTFLDMFNHKMEMPQNEWFTRNVTYSNKDRPQIRLPSVTFSDEAIYICDLTPTGGMLVTSETRLKVVACPETVNLDVINSTFPSLLAARNSVNNKSNKTTGITSTTPFSTGVSTFLRGTQILVRCSAVSYPAAAISISIPGLQLNKPEWQKLTKMPLDNGYERRALDAWFTLDGPDSLLRSKVLTIECKTSVANETCETITSIDLQLLLRNLNTI